MTRMNLRVAALAFLACFALAQTAFACGEHAEGDEVAASAEAETEEAAEETAAEGEEAAEEAEEATAEEA